MSSMVEKGHLPKVVTPDYDSVIQKFSGIGKAYAAELFFREAYEKSIKLQDKTYGSMLRAFSKEVSQCEKHQWKEAEELLNMVVCHYWNTLDLCGLQLVIQRSANGATTEKT
uniref:Uncharacterized protein n=1 Tax=Solanum lycopersicum TaxID=4081 RepID=A0A3Q7F5J2_SOLLC